MEAGLLAIGGVNIGSLTRITDEILVGRSQECSLCLVKPTVSRKHCRIFLEGDRFLIEDLRSLNGTLVNGNFVNYPLELKDGDSVDIAGVEFKFMLRNDGSLDEIHYDPVDHSQKITLKRFN